MNKRNRISFWIIIGITLSAFGILLTYFYEGKSVNNSVINEVNQLNDHDIVLGDYAAKKTIIMYSDYNCRYCKKFLKEVYPELYSNDIKNGEVKFVLRLVCQPTDQTAMNAYQTVVCINNYGEFNKLHKLLLHKSEIIYTDHFNRLIEEYINTNDQVAECILYKDQQDIKRNIYQFQSLKTKGTPTFVINDKVLIGFKDYHTIFKLLEKESIQH